MKMVDVPYYSQSNYNTCGSASLMMVLNYWDEDFELSRKNERVLWRKSKSYSFFGGILQFGIAKTAFELGYNVEIYQKNSFVQIDSRFNFFYHLYENFHYFPLKKYHIPVFYNRDIIDVIKDFINKDIPPLVFVNLKMISGENIYHWVVATGFDKENIFVNDPFLSKEDKPEKRKDMPIDRGIFERALSANFVVNLNLPPAIVVINGKLE